MTPATDAAREAIARIVVGPRNPVPEGSKWTLRELQNVRWSQCTRQEQGEALWIADNILAFADTEAASQPREWDGLAWRLDRIREDGGPLTASDKGILREAAAALTQRPPEQAGAVPTDAQVREAMQDAWDTFCDDAQAIPGDIQREGRKTYFVAGVWADHTAINLRAILSRAAAAPTPPDAGPGEIPDGMVDSFPFPVEGTHEYLAGRLRGEAFLLSDSVDGHRKRIDVRTMEKVEMPRDVAILIGAMHRAAKLMREAAEALTPKAPPQTPPDAGIGSDGAGERD